MKPREKLELFLRQAGATEKPTLGELMQELNALKTENGTYPDRMATINQKPTDTSEVIQPQEAIDEINEIRDHY